MVSSKFDLSCLAPTDNSLTKTFLLLLHFLVFCAFIITPHFHLCKHFLTFVFSKFKHTFYIHQKKGTHYICTPSNFNNFYFFSIPPAYPVKLLLDPITLWQGIKIDILLCPTALPTACADIVGEIILAISLYVIVLP